MEEFNFYSSENDGYRGGFGDYTDPVPPMPDTPLRTGPRAPKKKRGAAKVVALLLSCALVGGSAGREGAALQLGASLSAYIGRKLRLDEKDGRTVVMCGMAAAFSALFGTPLTAAVFAMEVVTVLTLVEKHLIVPVRDGL